MPQALAGMFSSLTAHPYLACRAQQGSVPAPGGTLHQVPVGRQLCREAAKVRRGPGSHHSVPGSEGLREAGAGGPGLGVALPGQQGLQAAARSAKSTLGAMSQVMPTMSRYGCRASLMWKNGCPQRAPKNTDSVKTGSLIYYCVPSSPNNS